MKLERARNRAQGTKHKQRSRLQCRLDQELHMLPPKARKLLHPAPQGSILSEMRKLGNSRPDFLHRSHRLACEPLHKHSSCCFVKSTSQRTGLRSGLVWPPQPEEDLQARKEAEFSRSHTQFVCSSVLSSIFRPGNWRWSQGGGYNPTDLNEAHGAVCPYPPLPVFRFAVYGAGVG